MRTIRLFLAFESLGFLAAALIHFGVLMDGYQHQKAGTAESVIAAALALGWALTWLRPDWTRRAGLIAQGFALLGTGVGIFTIVIGVGPRTGPDIAYHLAVVPTLAIGLFMAVRAGRTA